LKKCMPVVGWVIFWSGMMYVGYDYLSVLALFAVGFWV
jgi:hypothetical protein